MTRIRRIPRQQIHNRLYNKGSSSSSSRNWATIVAAIVMGLHIAAHGESLTAADMRATEGLLASVRVGVDSQGRRAQESLVAEMTDIAVMVMLEWGRGGRREVMVVLPGRVDWGDESRRRVRVQVRLLHLGLDCDHLGT